MSGKPAALAGIYEVIRQLGSGSGGVVYLARHLRLEKNVVLKESLQSHTANMEGLRREANALKNLSHSYIPQVYDFVVDDGKVYTVMDYIEGESFDRSLQRGERFSQALVVKWLRQLLEAVSYLHNRPPYGILHSDIKPANVMLTPDGDIRLIDFNIALALGMDGAVALGGSRGYASPEFYGMESLQEATGRRVIISDVVGTAVDKGGPGTILMSASTQMKTSNGKIALLDVRSDIYSLGATVYHILSGTRPAAKARDVLPLDPKQFSPGLIAILARSMHPDPDLRYQTAREMLADVNGLHKNDPRYRRHIRSRYVAGIGLSLLFFASGFSAFTGLKRIEQAQNALVLAEYSTNAFAQGNRDLAVQYALAALPEGRNLFRPPPAPQAAKALADALGIYDLADGYKAYRTLELPSAPFEIAVSPQGTTGAAVYAYEAVVFDMESGEITASFPAARSALAAVRFADETTLLYAGEDGLRAFDISQQRELWKGLPATAIAVSADGKTVAGVNRDSGEAAVYTILGEEKALLSFGGKRQWVPPNDSFANPGGNLFALNRDGSLLAVSFSDGSLDIFHTEDGASVQILPASGASYFEGGFSGDHLAFSAAGAAEGAVFAVLDTRNMEQAGGFRAGAPFGVVADESGIYVSLEDLIVKLDPHSGEQQEIAYTQADIANFSRGDDVFVVATQDHAVHFYDSASNPIEQFQLDTMQNFTKCAGNYAVCGGRDSPVLHVFESVRSPEADLFRYDPRYQHDEARMRVDSQRVMLFSYRGFRLYSIDGSLLCETDIPDSGQVTDQQYSPESGNLVVLYPSALRIYSGEDGSLLLEKTGLLSTFFASYGVSILEPDGTVSLIDADRCEVTSSSETASDFAALCGMTVDSAFLNGRELIGAAKNGGAYWFAVSDGVRGTIYSGDGAECFSFEDNGKSEAYFAGDVVIISPQHGTPTAYRVKSGKKLRDLESGAYMTYATAVGEYMISEYITADGERFGLLLDDRCETLAYLPGLTDTAGMDLLFDYKTGYLRRERIHSLEDLRKIAEGGKS